MKSPYPPTLNARRVQLELNDGLRLELLGHLASEPGFSGTRHRHAFWEVIYVHSGRGHYVYGKKKIPFAAGDCFLFEPGVFHRVYCDQSEPMTQLYVGFAVAGNSKSPWKPGVELPKLTNLSCGPQARRELALLYAACAKSQESGLNQQRGAVLRVIAWLIETLSNHSKSTTTARPDRSAALAGNARRYLDEHLDRHVTVEEIAESFYLSPHYFGNLFKSATGLSVKEYHHAARMAKAAELLREGNLNISEIAQALGFETVHYFSRRFKEFYRVAPTKFR